MALSTITPDDIAVELGRPTPITDPTRTQWQSWIDRTYRAIDRRAERLGIEPTTLDEQTLADVVTLAVVAHARRPDDMTQVTVSVDDGSTSKQYRSSQGRITILDEWWADLGLGSEADVFSIQMTGTPDVGLPWPSGGYWA